jgi:hypothetical protein
MCKNKKKGGPQTARNQADRVEPTAFPWCAAAAIGRATVWRLLPQQSSEAAFRRDREAR